MDFAFLGSAALAMALLFFVGQPLLASRQRLRDSAALDRRRQLVERREQLFIALRELDFDLEMGKLPAEDHRRLRQPLEEEALRVLHELDSANGRSDRKALVQRLEQDVQALRQRRTDRCSSCNAPRRDGDRFCSQCGHAFETL